MSEFAPNQILLACADPRCTARYLEFLLIRVTNWTAVVELAVQHKLLPTLYAAIAEKCPNSIDPDVLSYLRKHLHVSAVVNLQRLAEMTVAINVLQECDIPVIAFKGLTLSRFYSNFAMRESGDIDLLVPKYKIIAAIQALHSIGYKRKDENYAENLNGNCEVVFTKAEAAEIDLHWTLSAPYFFPFDDPSIWTRASKACVADHLIPVLSNEDLLLYLAIHGARSCWFSLHWILDVANIVEHGDLDWATLQRRAEEQHATRVLSVALLLAKKLCGSGPPCFHLIDDISEKLTSEIWEYILSGQYDIAATVKGALFHMRIMTAPRDRLRYLLCRGLIPNQTDNANSRLPWQTKKILYITRPLRIMGKAIRSCFN